MNILITSIGQRGYLVGHYRESGQGEVGVYAADANRFAPGLQDADKAFLIPPADSPDYYPALRGICLAHDIRGIVSINDGELPFLARYKEDFAREGVTAVVSDSDVIDLCADKYRTYRFCMENGIPTPRTYLVSEREKLLDDLKRGRIGFPLLAKPRRGSRSVGIYLVGSLDEYRHDQAKREAARGTADESILYQEYIDSAQYSVHVFNDAGLRPVTVVPMVNLTRRFGETFQIRTIRDEKLLRLGMQIGAKLRHYGPLSADIHKRPDGEYVVLEFNPRISGCYSLSHYAGADFPGKIYRLIRHEALPPAPVDEFEDGVVMLKQYVTVKTSEAAVNKKIANLTDFAGRV